MEERAQNCIKVTVREARKLTPLPPPFNKNLGDGKLFGEWGVELNKNKLSIKTMGLTNKESNELQIKIQTII